MHKHRQIVRSSQAALRLAWARRWLEAQTPGAEVLVLAANWEAADDLVRAVAASRGALLAVHRLTLNRLIGLLAADDLAARGLVPLSALATEAVAARAIHGLYAERDSSSAADADFFAAVAARPGFPAAVAGTLAQLRLAKVDPAALAALGGSAGALAAILERFEHELAAASLIDRAGLIRLAIAAAAARPRFLGLPTLILDVPVVSALERDLIAALAAHAPSLLATVACGDFRTQRHLEQALAVEAEELPRAPDEARCSLHLLQQHLFENSGPARCALDDSVTIFSAPGESRECVELVRAIQQRAERGVPFDQIAVLLHAPAQYLPHLQEALRRAEIPAYYCAGTRRPEPGGRALLALLACAAERLSARRFSEYLSLAQVPDRDAAHRPAPPFVAPDPELTPSGLGAELEAAPAVHESPTYVTDPTPVVEGTLRAPWRWEELIVEASVIGSQERWRRRLDGLREELMRRCEEVEEEASAARLNRQLLDLDHLREVALEIIDALAALPAKATWGEWLGRLRALTAMAVRDCAPVLAVLAELQPMAPVGPIGLEEVRLVLGERLGTLSERPPRRRYGAVFVGPAAAARGLSFEVVLVPALSERLFPRKVVEDPILTDAARRRISPDLELAPERVAAERLALRIAVGAARRQLCLSYPRLDIEQGRPRVPSFYALETLRAAEGYLPGFDELAERAAAAHDLRLGWPAPPDEQAAIDNAEFDLALLQRLVDADPDTTVGAAHYLLTANPHLARALRARGRRWLRRWTSADGLVDPDAAALAAMARHQLTARSFSATALQHYAECPYRFFLQAIHRLEPREEPEAIEALDPLTRGALFHEVQFDLLTALRERAMLPVNPGNIAAAQEMVDDKLRERAAYYHDRLAPAIEKVWEDGIAAIRADLREWLRRMAEEEARGWCPERFELSFGLTDREQADPASSTEAVALQCGLKLRGSIDLVERHCSGDLRVTDHKTGKVRAQAGVVVGGGKILQPVLYALAAEKLLGQPVASGRLYYCTSAGGYEERVVELSRKLQDAAGQPLDKTAREVAGDVVAIIGAALAEGFFPAAPDRGECAWCDYRTVCGPHEELRVKRKPPARLRSLAQLREMP